MKILDISEWTIYSGINMWIPAVLISIGWKKELDTNSVIDKVKSYWLSHVLISGELDKNPEIRTIVVWLVSIWYKVVIICKSSWDIEPFRSIRNVDFMITMEVPTETSNTINWKIFPLLKDGDELVFKITSLEDYNRAVVFLKSKLIIRPTISFSISIEDNNIYDEVLKHIILDSKNYIFNVRVLWF